MEAATDSEPGVVRQKLGNDHIRHDDLGSCSCPGRLQAKITGVWKSAVGDSVRPSLGGPTPQESTAQRQQRRPPTKRTMHTVEPFHQSAVQSGTAQPLTLP